MAILLIVIGLIGAAFTAKSFFAQVETQGEEFFSPHKIDHIVIDSNVGAKVRVHPTESDEIEVSWQGAFLKYISNAGDVSLTQEGSSLKIHIGRKLGNFNFSFNFGFLKGMEIDVYLPAKQYASIDIENNVGKTVVSSVSTDKLTVQSDVGSLTVENVQTETIDVTNDVGAINLKNVYGELTAKNDLGSIDIEVDDITHDMNIVSDVGSINLVVSDMSDNVSFIGDSEVGSVKVFGDKGSYINKQSDFIVSMKTDMGSIDVRTKK